MKRIVLISAIAASLAAPAMADVNFAIAHFNQDKDSAAEVIAPVTGENTATVSTRNASPLSFAFDEFNASIDSAADRRGLEQATVVNGMHSAAAQEIFAQLRAESLDDE